MSPKALITVLLVSVFGAMLVLVGTMMRDRPVPLTITHAPGSGNAGPGDSGNPEAERVMLESMRSPHADLCAQRSVATRAAPTAVTGHWIATRDFDEADRVRLHCVNAALARAGLPLIEASAARMLADDLAAFRAIVDSAETAVSKAEDEWLSMASGLTSELEADLLARIGRGQTAGLPLSSKDNPFERRHPHEAITQVLHDGQVYVLRVGPRESPGLADRGRLYDDEVMRRTREYDQLLRQLLVASPGK